MLKGITPRLNACAPRRITRRFLQLRAVPIGTVLNFITTTLQKCEAVPSGARIESSLTVVSLNSRLESNEEEEEFMPLRGVG